MNILITGATGLVGSALVNHFSNEHQLTLVGRSREKMQSKFSSQYTLFTWSELKHQREKCIQHQDIIINLSGENIGDKRWSETQKQKIIESRVDATRLIAEICARLDKPPRILNASAVGIYGFSDTTVFTENSALTTPECFLKKVGMAWEQALSAAEKVNVPIVRMRFGVVLSKKGGALKKMFPAFQLGLGAVLGDGKQFFSWVALPDLIRAIHFLVNHPEIAGAVNIVSPGVISQRHFAKELARTLHRPFFMRFPAWFVRLLFGQMGDELLLHGQSVKSERLLQAGFSFQYENISQAFKL
ncbi:MAG: TIGR01777 family protein [Gammaproteobacteria bacterium RIFCSPHIGHO2_12_FULL_37_14]|nr:MAG: TIGR01777 family protein [Gammaproteobacteria bacterium RIFCSPHIGHO2_12_FULL_37_14]